MSESPYAFNWKQSSAHIWFLTTFLEPRQPDNTFQGIDWQKALGEPPAQAVHRFLKLVILVPAPLTTRMKAEFSRAKLQQFCRERDLATSGNKDELINRLINADWSGMEAAATVKMVQCSDYGRGLAEKYLADPQSLLRQAAPTESQEENISVSDQRKILRWLRASLVVAGGFALDVLSNAVYDWLKELDKEAGESTDDLPRGSRDLKKATTLAPRIKLEWCYVPAGEFLMGSADSDQAAYDFEKPQHRVYVDAFYLGKYPITNEQYRVFVQKTGHRQPDHWKDGFPRDKANHPVVYVSWSDAVAFCEWAARAAGVPIRLLTEAEWEKGARGTDGRIYPWDNSWQPTYCNTSESNIKDTTPVDCYPRGHSPYGAYDMIGNVWEWTSTIYKPYPYKANDGREDMNASGYHVLRGGSSYTTKSIARAAYRVHDIGYWYDFNGFRVGVAAPFSFPL